MNSIRERFFSQTINFHLHYRRIKKKNEKKSLKTEVFNTSLHRQILCGWYSCQKHLFILVFLGFNKEQRQHALGNTKIFYISPQRVAVELHQKIFLIQITTEYVRYMQKIHLIKRWKMNPQNTSNHQFLQRGGLFCNSHLSFYS